ncbi:MAG: TetR/AcrR family transcriptional regulator [Halanaerobiales bacterium]
MPKETFFNLPEAKKRRVVEAALDEFAQNTYYKASINRIVKKADIAKGSFYQYFADKKDIYRYIINIIGQRKLKYLQQVIENMDEFPFFQLLREIYKAGIKFARNHPRLNKIGNNLYQNQKLLNEIMEDQKYISNDFFINLLEKGKKEGEVDPDINIELTAHILTNMNVSLGEYIYKAKNKHKINLEDMEIVDKMLYIIEHGISSKS